MNFIPVQAKLFRLPQIVYPLLMFDNKKYNNQTVLSIKLGQLSLKTIFRYLEIVIIAFVESLQITIYYSIDKKKKHETCL